MFKINLMPELTNLAALTIAKGLWMQTEIFNEIINLICRPFYRFQNKGEINIWLKEGWLVIQRKILRKLTRIHLSPILKDLVEDFVLLIGLQIRDWLVNHLILFGDRSICYFMPFIQWNSQGVINSKQTALNIIQTNIVFQMQNFLLACNNLLPCVDTIWDNLSSLEKHELWERFCSNDDPFVSEFIFIGYWIRNKCGKWDFEHNDPEFLTHAWIECNYEIVKYYFEKVNDEEKAMIAFDTMSLTTIYEQREIAIYLLSQLNSNEILDSIEEQGCCLLNLWFKVWIFQNRIIFDLDCIWNFVTTEHFQQFFEIFFQSLYSWFPSNYYKKCRRLFLELWNRQFSNELKRNLFNNPFLENCIRYLVLTLDVECLELLFESANYEEKKMMIKKSQDFYDEETFSYDLSLLIGNIRTKITLCAEEILECRRDFKRLFRYHIYSSQEDELKLPVLDVLKKWLNGNHREAAPQTFEIYLHFTDCEYESRRLIIL